MSLRRGPALLPCSAWMLLSVVLLVCAANCRSGSAASGREGSPPPRATAAGAAAPTSSGRGRPAGAATTDCGLMQQATSRPRVREDSGVCENAAQEPGASTNSPADETSALRTRPSSAEGILDTRVSRRMSALSSRCHKYAVLQTFDLAYILAALPMAVAGQMYSYGFLCSVGIIMLAGGVILEGLSFVAFRHRRSQLSDIVPFTADNFNAVFSDQTRLFSSFLLVLCAYIVTFFAAIAASGDAPSIATGVTFMGAAILTWAFASFPSLRAHLQRWLCRRRASTDDLQLSSPDTEAQTTHLGDEVEMLPSRPEVSAARPQGPSACSALLAGCANYYATLVTAGGAFLALAAAAAYEEVHDNEETSSIWRPHLPPIGYAGAAYMLFALLATAIRGVTGYAARAVRSAARLLPQTRRRDPALTYLRFFFGLITRLLPQTRWHDPALTYLPFFFGLITCIMGFVEGYLEATAPPLYPSVMLSGIAAIGVLVALLPGSWIAWQCAGGALPIGSRTTRQRGDHTVERRDRAGPTTDRVDGQDAVELEALEGTSSTAPNSDDH